MFIFHTSESDKLFSFCLFPVTFVPVWAGLLWLRSCCLLDWSRLKSTTNMVLRPYSLGWLWCKILDCIGMDLCSCLSRCISVCCSVTILLLHIPGWIKPLRLVDVNQRWTCSLQIPAPSSETRQTHQVYSTEHIKPYSFFAVMEEAAVLKADRPTSDWPRDV